MNARFHGDRLPGCGGPYSSFVNATGRCVAKKWDFASPTGLIPETELGDFALVLASLAKRFNRRYELNAHF